MELTDGWRAHDADDALRRVYYQEDFDDRGWEPVTVPGHWRSHAAFSGSDGPLLHRCRFARERLAPGRRAWLTYQGIFYQADHWIDGTYLGDTEGYFMPHTFEVTDALRDRSEHVLSLEVACTPQPDKAAKRNITGVFQHWGGIDPDWNPGGLWRPVQVSETGPVRIAELGVLCTEVTRQRASVAFRAVLDSDAARTVRLHTVIGGLEHAADHPLAAGTNTLDWTVTVERPELWWPHTLGSAHLYDVRVAAHLTDDDPGLDPVVEGSAEATVSDERLLRTGLRKVEMRNWICSVNGERLFLKGTNLAPTRADIGYATPEELERDVQLAAGTGLDLLRIHAHISRPELYDAADEAGMLLWQDFPLQKGYARGVRAQAVRQARQAVALLGHHPAVAIWCAHNEPVAVEDPEAAGGNPLERLALGARAFTRQQLPSWNRTVLDTSVKRALERADRTRPVIPQSGTLPHPPRLDGTDSHLYLGWSWGDERRFPGLLRTLPRLARFVTEFGAQAVPSGDGADWMDPQRWPYLDWDRLSHVYGLDKAAFSRYVPPGDYPTFDAWRDATQRYQATIIKHHVETLRRLKYRPTGGFAQFHFADCMPAVSCSVLDHERRPKLGYDALRAACRPVIVAADRPPAQLVPGHGLTLDVHAVSDRRDPVTGAVLTATLSWLGGNHSLRWSGDLPADDCVKVGTVDTIVPDAPGPLVLDLVLRLPDGEDAVNRYESSIVGR